MAEIYLASYKEVPNQKPLLMCSDGRRDKTKFCRFHSDYGHYTNESRKLKDEIEFLLHMRKLSRYQSKPETPRRNQKFHRQMSPPLEPIEEDFTLEII